MYITTLIALAVVLAFIGTRTGRSTPVEGDTPEALAMRLSLARVRREASHAVLHGADSFEAMQQAREREAERIALHDKPTARKFVRITAELNALDLLYPEAYRIHVRQHPPAVVEISCPHFREDYEAATHISD